MHAAAAAARHDALPHVEVVDAAVFREQPRQLDVVVELQAVVDEIVVQADADQAFAPELGARRCEHLAQEGHALIERCAAVFILAAVAVRVEEVGEQVVHPDREFDPVEIAATGARCRDPEACDNRLDLVGAHLVRDQDWRGEIGRGHRGGRQRRAAEERGAIGDAAAAMAELRQERHVEFVGAPGHALVSLDDAVVEARQRKRDVAIEMRDGMAGDDDRNATLGALAQVVDVLFGRYAVAGLEMRGMAGIHEAVLEGQRADAQRLE